MIVDLLATYQKKCANDYKYYDEYDDINSYWKEAVDCQDEGTIKSFFDSFDSMDTQMFLYNNKIPVNVSNLLNGSLDTV